MPDITPDELRFIADIAGMRVLDEDVEPSGEIADRVREAVKLCPSSALSLAED